MTYFDLGRVHRGVLAERGRGRPQGRLGLPLSPGHITSLVRVPLSLAVVAEAEPAARPLARDPGARGAPGRDHGEGAVGPGAPAGVWVRGQDPAEHEDLVELREVAVLVSDEGLDVWKRCKKSF